MGNYFPKGDRPCTKHWNQRTIDLKHKNIPTYVVKLKQKSVLLAIDMRLTSLALMFLCRYFFLKNTKNLGRSDDGKRRKKRGWPNLVLCLTKFVDTLLQPISKSQKSYLSLKRQMWKTEHFLFRWTLLVLTQICSKTRVYWNCLSQRIWKFLQR